MAGSLRLRTHNSTNFPVTACIGGSSLPAKKYKNQAPDTNKGFVTVPLVWAGLSNILMVHKLLSRADHSMCHREQSILPNH